MKKILSSIWLFSLCSWVILAQNPATTLQHTGTTSVFYGQSSFADALTASVNGDTLYLSAGYFTAPSSIEKGVKVFGSGHFPDSANVAKRTFIMGGLTISKGADGLNIEGMYINGDIKYDAASSINYIKIIRCRLASVYFNSNVTSASKNFCSYEECFIEGGIDFSNYGTNFLVKHCIISGHALYGCCYYTSIVNINEGALIDGNVFLFSNNYSDDGVFSNIHSTLIQNNIIIHTSSGNLFRNASGNNVFNNLFVLGSIDFSINSQSNNYTGVAIANIFINQTGNTVNYTNDYHLKSPATYLGTDGTQVGLYGGLTPFKDKGLPSNPQVIKKSVAAQTDANGNLQINFTVKAQDN
jgi:hypothetical protein